LKQVDLVNRVVQRAAAALFFPGTAPPQIVIVAAAPPKGIDLGVHDLADQASVEHAFHFPHLGPETILCDDRQQFIARLGGLQHRITFLQRGRHRFFHQHMLAGL